ncbi:MAG: hypothetical protein GQ577_10335 [Woeseiaceae bacterium]|nr:hypothetical protein [Woeseiaceae bacterium]
MGIQKVTTFSLRGLNGQLQFIGLEVWVSRFESVLESLNPLIEYPNFLRC